MNNRLLISLFVSCSYLISCEKLGTDYPRTFIDDASYTKNELSNIDRDSLVLFQWNIGHFSNGVYQYPTLDTSKANEFRDFVLLSRPDILSINEYSRLWGSSTNYTRETVFGIYTYAYLGAQNNYSCNAIFSGIPLYNVKYNTYRCNAFANITHTSLVKAEDYYYLSSLFNWKNHQVNFVSTHLAFDKYDDDVVKNQIMELIESFDKEEYVVMCGDWNSNPEVYEIFIEKGYTLLSTGKDPYYITFPSTSQYFDNIMIKGLSMSNIKIIKTDLSDHYPILCTISLND